MKKPTPRIEINSDMILLVLLFKRKEHEFLIGVGPGRRNLRRLAKRFAAQLGGLPVYLDGEELPGPRPEFDTKP